MENVTSDDGLDEMSERFESYSLSADVSESESSSGGFSCRQFDDQEGASTSLTSSPLLGTEFADNSGSSTSVPIMLPAVGGRNIFNPAKKTEKPNAELSEVELMKERFAKLLLGEDMSGGGKGVCTALAISNATTNLSASVFGELWKLKPLAPQKKLMWQREMDWLLCICDSIVELVPSVQEFPGGGTFEVMVTRPRSDLYVNLPALKKLNAMLISILDGFGDSEFYYVERGIVLGGADEDESSSSCSSRPSIRQEEKWWLPFPKVPQNGLYEKTRKRLQQCRECTSQILKAAMAINGNVLAEMEIPDAYLKNLPKSGKECLGDVMYHYLTADHFSPKCLLDYLDQSSEYTTLEIANKIEAAANIWRQKSLKKQVVHRKGGRPSWGRRVKGFVGEPERNKLLAHRAETILQNLKLRFPSLPQTVLDMSKIQYNKDVGHSILESYSRVMEGLAFNIMARIDDLLYVDDATRKRAAAERTAIYNKGKISCVVPIQKPFSPSPFSVQQHPCASSFRVPPSHCSNEIVRSPVGSIHPSPRKSNLRNPLDGEV